MEDGREKGKVSSEENSEQGDFKDEQDKKMETKMLR